MIFVPRLAGNPQRHDNDPATDDDAIYHSLSRENRPGSSLLTALFGVLVLVPSLYLLLWCMSMCGSWCCRLDGSNRRYWTAQEIASCEVGLIVVANGDALSNDVGEHSSELELV
jgi:hypothetical protein